MERIVKDNISAICTSPQANDKVENSQKERNMSPDNKHLWPSFNFP